MASLESQVLEMMAADNDSNDTIHKIQSNSRAVCINIGDFLRKELPAREIMLSPWLTKQSLAMLYAWRGIGKSWLALSIGYSVASGGTILGWNAPQKRRVLFIDGELPAPTLQQRLSLIVNSFDCEPEKDGFQLLTPDLQKDGTMPNLLTTIGREMIDCHANDADLIIVDNLSTLARGGKENEGESWLPVQEWALRHRAQGRSILFVHHAGKGGAQRGTSRREDVLDTVISLRRPAEYENTEGAKFELLFEKARNLTGDDAQPLEVELKSFDDRIEWKYKPASDAILDRVEELAADGAGRQEIMIETGLSRFQLKRMIDRARESGRMIVIADARKK
ncbi:AAA family ATPase [Nitrosomonas sp.]|uniref:AAA family ATPase n=1 Tax=Nitrosomonas sp. TaxID=42353 RepID=UPI001D26D1B9|nr:AAA family ATPase [Nitrosomonas sp.]MBX3616986.1 AAA family ATPase [Nitrosomonas sp.]